MDTEKRTPLPGQRQDSPGTVDNISEQISGEPPKNAATAAQISDSAKVQKQRKNRVLIYLLLLFAFAFLLLLLSYVINQRNNSDAMSNLTETHRVFSENAAHSLAVLQRENEGLREDRDTLAGEVEGLQAQLEALENRLEAAEETLEDTAGRNAELEQQLTESAEAAEQTALLRELLAQGLQAMLAEDAATVLTVRNRLNALNANAGGTLLSEQALGEVWYDAYRQLADWELTIGPEEAP